MRPGDAVRVLPSGREEPRRAHRDCRRRPRLGGRRRVRDADARRRGRRQPRRRARGGAMRRRASRTSSRRQSCGCTRSRCCRAAPICSRSARRRSRRPSRRSEVRVNVNTLEQLPAKRLELNEIGVCELELDRRSPFEPYAENRALGGFILIDRLTNNTVGAGLLHFALRRSHNVHWQALDVNKAARARAEGPAAAVRALVHRDCRAPANRRSPTSSRRQLHALGRHTYLLDGDNVRHGLNRDLGFTEAGPGREHPPRRRGGPAHGRRRA